MKDARQERGEAISKVAVIAKRADGSYAVPSMSGNGRYTVNVNAEKPTCTCPDHENGFVCKHIHAVLITMKRETTHHADGSTTITETVEIKATKRPTYRQDWPAYNAAQTNEGDEFRRLLADLCEPIMTPAPKSKKGGRPALPLADITFACIYKIYSTFSGRRFISDLRSAHEEGLVSRLPHYNSIFTYLENPEMTPILQYLIAETSKPLAAVETEFAADSSGFSTSRFVRWFDHKYGTVKVEHDWVKCHIMCGVKTHVVTAVNIQERHTQDSPLLPDLTAETKKNFDVKEVSADKGYSSIDNIEKLSAMGITPFIMFKKGHTGTGGGMWAKMFHFFSFKRDEFLSRYHLRSNVESVFSMVKAKTGDSVRSKTDVAMHNEALCKFICHNICCLISAIYELGIQPTFFQQTA